MYTQYIYIFNILYYIYIIYIIYYIYTRWVWSHLSFATAKNPLISPGAKAKSCKSTVWSTPGAKARGFRAAAERWTLSDDPSTDIIILKWVSTQHIPRSILFFKSTQHILLNGYQGSTLKPETFFGTLGKYHHKFIDCKRPWLKHWEIWHSMLARYPFKPM
jgi:hypothetical protein